MKKIITYIIIITMLVCINNGLNVSAQEDNYTGSDYRYIFNGSSIWITHYLGDDEYLEIPSTIDGYPVLGIGNHATITSRNPNGNFLRGVIIPEGIKEISDKAFFEETLLEYVQLPESLEKIQHQAFDTCTSLKEVTIPKNVNFIGDDAFYDCDSLQKVTITGNPLLLYRCFSNCSALTTVHITGNLNQIGDNAFRSCKMLKQIEIPEGVKTIGYMAFVNSGLESVIIPESVELIDFGAFAACYSLTDIVVKNPETKIELYRRDRGHPDAPAPIPAFAAEANPDLDKLIFDGGTIRVPRVYAPINSQAHEYANLVSSTFMPVVKVELNGEEIKTDMPPVIVNNRVLIPARAMFEALGAEVGWDEATQTVSATSADKKVELSIDDRVMKTNNTISYLDAAPTIMFDRTMVPARAVSESFGAKVKWDEARQTVVVRTIS